MSICALVLLMVPTAAERDWSVEIVGKGEAISVAPLAQAEADAWKAAPPKDPAGVLAVYVGTGDLAMLGEWKIDGQKLLFVPRFPLAPGTNYRVVLHPEKLPGFVRTRPDTITKTVSIPKPPPGPPAFVEQVYPTADVVPENQLRLYIHFSAPMSQGGVYKHIRLLDAGGKEIKGAFLEIDEELWDRDVRRLTVFFDPGRIKRGLRPREDEGPIFEDGKTYTLEIDAAWKDAQGQPLKEAFRRTFKATAPDDTQPEVEGWKLAAPRAGTREPLTVTFPESLDHALAQRLIWVANPSGERIPGKATLGKHERTWIWTPEQPWQAGEFRLVADKRLEDLAGNSIAKPFEIDVFKQVDREIKTETVGRAFRVEK